MISKMRLIELVTDVTGNFLAIVVEIFDIVKSNGTHVGSLSPQLLPPSRYSGIHKVIDLRGQVQHGSRDLNRLCEIDLLKHLFGLLNR